MRNPDLCLVQIWGALWVNLLHLQLNANRVVVSFTEGKEGREGKDVSCTEELELELEALDIADDTLELEAADEAENEELAKKLLDEQGG